MFQFRHQFPIKIRTLYLFVLLISLLLLIQNYLMAIYTNQENQFSWEYYTIVPLIDYTLWILVTPFIFELAMRYSFVNKNPKAVFYHSLYGLIIVLIHRILSTSLQSSAFYLVDGIWFNPFEGYMARAMIGGFVLHFVIYWILVGLFSVFQYQKGLQQKEIELSRLENELNTAQLNALKMQLNPHFLFNTLHSISSLMGSNKKGQKVISKLASLLRFMLYKNKEHENSLENELEYISSYLYIEEIRFEDRLTVNLDIAKNTLQARIPTLILQALVENSLKHAFNEKTDNCIIQLLSRIENEQLVLIVEDNGIGINEIKQDSKNAGIGLKNVKDRLNFMFKDNYSLIISSNKHEGFKVTIKIPFKKGI